VQIVHGRAAGATAQARSGTFTGTVYGDPVLPSTDGTTVNSVTFTPGARTYWHHHERGQLLVVTAGSGWVCAHGEAPQPLTVGDLVWTAPGERHWHGAGPGSILTHLAVSLGTTTWLDEVSQAEYGEAR
jgi:quercetin dioxygenase-like cupin family protein